MIILIWAEDEQGCIGKDNALPWHLPADLAYFRKQTLDHTVVMGRKTFESFGSRILPRRKNVILTRDKTFVAENAEVCYSKEDVLSLSEKEQIYIIGGAEIYTLFWEHADFLLQTKIHHTFDGDTFFPKEIAEPFMLIQSIPGMPDEKNVYVHDFRIFQKREDLFKQ